MMTLVQTHTKSAVAEAWRMIEDATPGDTLAVGVALDYVMDNYNAGSGCSREEAKTLLYRYVAELLTNLARDHIDQSAATSIALYLFADRVQDAKLYMQGYGTHNEWSKRAKRLVKLCSWVEGTP